MIERDALFAALAAMVRTWGGDGQLVDLFAFEEGHAGLTYGFSVAAPRQPVRRYVLKLSPPGVARRGANDVYRQARLLRTLSAAGLPVPDVLAAGADETELGAPYIVMQRLPGRTFIVWEPHETFDLGSDKVAVIWREAAQTLARIHSYDWRKGLAEWESPRSARAELDVWGGSLEKSTEPRWTAAGRALAEGLAQAVPQTASIGLMHGDFQPGNLLFEDGVLHGVIDWDLAGIGPQGLDLGWLLMMADPACWRPDWPPRVSVDVRELAHIYEEARGQRVPDLDWFEALACYRMGAIACLNVRLHRSGRRPDALWERFAPSIDTLFARGRALLRAAGHRG